MMAFFRKLKWVVQRRRREGELQEELQFHLDEEAEQQRAEGASMEEASLAARRELGNAGLVQEDTRSAWGWTMAEQLGQDLRYAFRTMAGNRMFTVLVVVSLALGIGANTAIYSFMDAILLRSLPVSDPGSLVVFKWRAKAAEWGKFVMHSINGSTYDDPRSGGTTAGIFPYPAFEIFRRADRVFSSVFAYQPAYDLNMIFRGNAELESGEYVSGDYFRGLAVAPAAGRLIIEDDDRVGAQPVAVINRSRSNFGNSIPALTEFLGAQIWYRCATSSSEFRAQPKTFRRTGECRRSEHSDQQRALRCGWGDAARIFRRRSRCGSGCVSSDTR